MLIRAGVLVMAVATTSAAQTASAPGARNVVDGYVSLTGDTLPNVNGGAGATELRARLFLERAFAPSPRVRVFVSGWVDGLIANRGGAVRDAKASPHEAYVDLRAGRLDVRAGLATVVWGRLDEVQPSDVVNPLDVLRYLFEGRGEGRIPVPLVRGRWFFGEHAQIEAVWVPLFVRGRFDRLDEATSPFNLVNDVAICLQPDQCVRPLVGRDTPPRTLAGSQGGVRVSTTLGRVDWSVSAYRGTRGFGVYEPVLPVVLPGVLPGGGGSLPLVLPSIGSGLRETFPRFTMIASDVETTQGEWAFRGEIAAAWDEATQPPGAVLPLEGSSVDAGLGVERKAGDFQVSGTVLVRHRSADGFRDTTTSLVAGTERRFARETRIVRAFAAWNLAESAAFTRGILAWSLSDNLWVEGSLGWFFGEGSDTFARFHARDFLSLKLKRFF